MLCIAPAGFNGQLSSLVFIISWVRFGVFFFKTSCLDIFLPFHVKSSPVELFDLAVEGADGHH